MTDVWDWLFFVGLVVAGVGLWLFAPWVSLLSVGGVLMAVGGLGAWSARSESRDVSRSQ